MTKKVSFLIRKATEIELRSMKHTIIIYASQYGSTKRYAEHLSAITGIKCVSRKEAADIQNYERIIYMGALFAGSVLGLRKFAATVTNQELIIITVGLVDPQDEENIRYIRNNIKSQIPAHLYDEDKIFHLRGAIDYSTMGLKHKLMMKFMHSRLSKMPEEELNAESKVILETYGKKVDYVDFNTLQPIVSIL
ncbi:MAG: flavodoxin domain-containing protein [Prevotella sp.]|nr:flavodoxin domain-containing protein [Prevotella sp.]